MKQQVKKKKKPAKKAGKKKNSLTQKEIEYYLKLYRGAFSIEEIKEWGKKRLEDFKDEWFGTGSCAMPSNSNDCPGCWNLKERCTCTGAPKIKTRQEKSQDDIRARTSDHDFSIHKYRTKYKNIDLGV
jgi:hypothetical protein